MPFVTAASAEAVEAGVAAYGAPPGGKAMIAAEMAAADEALRTGVYIVWRSARQHQQDLCARVGPASRCMCGHPLRAHAPIDAANPRPPPCREAGCGCARFEYIVSRPEECGMYWLPRRKGFDVRTWRAPCKCGHGHDAHDPASRRCRRCGCGAFVSDFCCLSCDGSAEEHETVFELASERAAANRPIGEAFRPLHGCSAALQAAAGVARRPAPARSSRQEPPSATPEELLERGAITAAEYRRMLASLPEQQERAEATDGALARRTQQHVPPTVRVARLDLGDPRGHAEVVTNIGPPLPVPGKDWSRPWEPAASPSARNAAGTRAGQGAGASARTGGKLRRQ